MQGIGASNDQLFFEKDLKGNIVAQAVIHLPEIFSGDDMRKIIIALILSVLLSASRSSQPADRYRHWPPLSQT